MQQAANWIVLDSVLATLDGDQLHASVAAAVRSELDQWQRWLAGHAGRGMIGDNRRQAAAYLEQYLRDPAGTKRRPLPVIPPGAPI